MRDSFTGKACSTHKMRWQWMSKLINKYEWKTGVEIGVKEGLFCQYILKNTNLKKLYYIDPWEQEPDLYKRLKQVYGETKRVRIIRKKSQDAVNDVPQVDFVFIDGDHSYDAVKSDIKLYLPKAKYFLCGHDYDYKDVKKAVDELLGLTKRGYDGCWGYYCG